MSIENTILNSGFAKASVNIKILNYISNKIFENLKEILNIKIKNRNFFFNNFHKFIKSSELNEIRLKIISSISSDIQTKKKIFLLVKEYLDKIVGNEIAMQKSPNLVIQFPKDESFIVDLHADTWGGNSPFEIIAWLPLVNCYKTKSMFILDGHKNKKILDELEREFKAGKAMSTEKLYKKIEKKITWLNVNYGEVIFFNPALPHGARKNLENETRFSINCRFKGIFTPYGDKKLGEYFEPITLKPMSKLGFKYLDAKKI